MQNRSSLASVLIHVTALLALLGVFAHAPRIAPYQLPGTAQGTHLLTYYAAGSPPQPQSDLAAKTKQAAATTSSRLNAPQIVEQKKTVAPPSEEAGTGSDLDAGIGSGDIRIALQKYFPHPTPSLSSMQPGSQGDVILDATIDQTGKITKLTLIKGLGPAIDNVVIATVEQWTYSPATKNGTPVPSEQELHFHYERKSDG